MEAGLPFICTDYVLWCDILNRYESGFYVKPGNIEQINRAIHFLTENPQLAFEMGQNGKNAILSEFNWDNQEKVYVHLYSKLASDSINL